MSLQFDSLLPLGVFGHVRHSFLVHRLGSRRLLVGACILVSSRARLVLSGSPGAVSLKLAPCCVVQNNDVGLTLFAVVVLVRLLFCWGSAARCCFCRAAPASAPRWSLRLTVLPRLGCAAFALRNHILLSDLADHPSLLLSLPDHVRSGHGGLRRVQAAPPHAAEQGAFCLPCCVGSFWARLVGFSAFMFCRLVSGSLRLPSLWCATSS